MGIIKIEDVSHVRFTAPDLGEMRAFLADFGMDAAEHGGVLYGRGNDGAPFVHVTEQGDPSFIGLGLRAESLADLAVLAAHDGVAVEPFGAPGGGAVVRLRDPDGNLVEVVAGQTWDEPQPLADAPPFNSAGQQPRQRAGLRLVAGPAHVRRLGHVVLNVTDFRKSERWYKDRFGFITSDEIEAAPGVSMGAFMRCDRGDRPTDHHTLFLAQLPSGKGFNHAAFEVLGLDDLMLGHTHLHAKKRKPSWGIGRHVLGSQIFDYWLDPWGRELEHWTDGDRFIAADGSNMSTVAALLDVQWGMAFPPLRRKVAPSAKTMARVMALNIRIRRLFRRDKQGAAA